MSALDEDTDALLAELESGPSAPNHKVVSLNDKSVPAGGRAPSGRNIRRPGPSISSKRTESEREELQQEEAHRELTISSDPVVRSTEGKDSLKLLGAIRAEIAQEAARLKHQRELYENAGKDITTVTRSRIDALKKMSDIEMEMRKIGIEQIDVRGEKFQRIFRLFVEMVRESAEDTLSAESIDLFFNSLTTKLEGWEEKAEDVIR